MIGSNVMWLMNESEKVFFVFAPGAERLAHCFDVKLNQFSTERSLPVKNEDCFGRGKLHEVA